MRDLWIIKIGEVDRSWRIGVDQSLPYEVRLRKTARQFRYWIDENIIEIAALDLDQAETRAVLKQGRCGKEDCQELNHGRSKMVSKITFIDGSYRQLDDADQKWVRILPPTAQAEKGKEKSNVGE